MRSTLLVSGLAAGVLLAMAGCGSSTPPKTATTTTTAPAARATPTTTTQPNAAANEDEDYELDVIAEAEPDEGAPPLKVQFTASVEEETGGPFTFSWDFGDGQKSTDQNPVHTYDKVRTVNGEYGERRVKAPGPTARVRLINTDNGPMAAWVLLPVYIVWALPTIGWLGFTVAAALLVLAVGFVLWSLHRGRRTAEPAGPPQPEAPTTPLGEQWG